MGRPHYKKGVKPPNTANIRIPPEAKLLIQQSYRKLLGHGSPGMPIGDKLLTVLRAYIKKVEALESQVLDLHEALQLEVKVNEVRNKGLRR
jgi:hypothetical protein